MTSLCSQMKPKTFTIPSKHARISQPSIILAFDWFDERLYRGIFNYAKMKGWHMSSYMISDRFIPRGWPGDGAITCYGPILRDFIDHLDMPIVDITIEEMSRKAPRVVVDNRKIGEMAADHFHSRGYLNYAYYSWAEVTVNTVRREAFFHSLLERGVPRENLFEIP